MSVFITGANRGIGLELANTYRAAGQTVYATSRQSGAGLLPLDVTDPAAQKRVAALVTLVEDINDETRKIREEK